MATNEVVTPTNIDVLFGRDKVCFNHPGNISFRTVINAHAEDYEHAPTRRDKSCIVYTVFDTVRAYGGRFLKRAGPLKEWVVVSDVEATQKVGHALRDKKQHVDTPPARQAKANAHFNSPYNQFTPKPQKAKKKKKSSQPGAVSALLQLGEICSKEIEAIKDREESSKSDDASTETENSHEENTAENGPAAGMPPFKKRPSAMVAGGNKAPNGNGPSKRLPTAASRQQPVPRRISTGNAPPGVAAAAAAASAQSVERSPGMPPSVPSTTAAAAAALGLQAAKAALGPPTPLTAATATAASAPGGVPNPYAELARLAQQRHAAARHASDEAKVLQNAFARFSQQQEALRREEEEAAKRLLVRQAMVAMAARQQREEELASEILLEQMERRLAQEQQQKQQHQQQPQQQQHPQQQQLGNTPAAPPAAAANVAAGLPPTAAPMDAAAAAVAMGGVAPASGTRLFQAVPVVEGEESRPIVPPEVNGNGSWVFFPNEVSALPPSGKGWKLKLVPMDTDGGGGVGAPTPQSQTIELDPSKIDFSSLMALEAQQRVGQRAPV